MNRSISRYRPSFTLCFNPPPLLALFFIADHRPINPRLSLHIYFIDFPGTGQSFSRAPVRNFQPIKINRLIGRSWRRNRCVANVLFLSFFFFLSRRKTFLHNLSFAASKKLIRYSIICKTWPNRELIWNFESNNYFLKLIQRVSVIITPLS